MKKRHIFPLITKEYEMPTEVFFGRDKFNKLSEIISSNDLNNILIVTGKHLRNDSQFESILNDLRKLRLVDVYDPVIKKSDFNSVNSLIGYVRQEKIGCIIAIGGGAILDSVKCAAVLAKNQGMLEDYLITGIRMIQTKGIFNISIPTTSGTGSEVTPWAVIWGNKKYSLSSPDFMFPEVAIVDPSLTDTLSRENTAEPGIDALSQAIEAYWNVKHNPISDEYALDAIKTVLDNLEKAVNNPTQDIRDKMSWGSLSAGLAFSNTQTTICHAVSYPITAHWNVSHGQAVSITLPSFIEYTLPVLKTERRKKLLEAIGAIDEKGAANKIRNLMMAIGLKTKLSELGILPGDIGLIVAEGFNPERAKNSPRIPAPEELQKILRVIY